MTHGSCMKFSFGVDTYSFHNTAVLVCSRVVCGSLRTTELGRSKRRNGLPSLE